MIRPLIESIYDYNMTFPSETTANSRSNYKTQYYEACSFVAADCALTALNQPDATLESVIDDWNAKNNKANKDRKEEKLDYKGRLDELFRGAGKSYYRKDYDRTFSRERSPEYKESRYSGDHHYSRSRDHYNYNNSRFDSYHKN